MSLELIEQQGTSNPCRYQGVCSACGWHWPKGGYVQLRSIEALFADHDCHPSAHVGSTCNEPRWIEDDQADSYADEDDAEAFAWWRSQQ